MLSKEERPWGWFETIEESKTYKLKKIYVKPKQQFSLQYHNERDEHWIIVEGSGVITLGGNRFNIFPNSSFFIERGVTHRLMANDEGITFYEVQYGMCDESDIKRVEDDYGRVK